MWCRRKWLCVLTAMGLLLPSASSALTFQVDFASSTYQVVAGDTWASLLLQHQSETPLSSTSLDLLDGVAAPVYAGVNTDYSLLMTTVIDVDVAGTYTFQVGTDWGRGGAAVVIDNGTGTLLDEFDTTEDIWWANDWNNSDVFTTSAALAVGSSYTIGWVGFEGCCGGSATIRFSVDGAPYQVISNPGLTPFVSNPEPGTAVLLGLGVAMLARRRRSTRLR
jgi:hypothetical protein